MISAQTMADFWARQVRLGLGDSSAQLDPRGLIQRLPAPGRTAFDFVMPEPDEMYRDGRRIILLSARLVER